MAKLEECSTQEKGEVMGDVLKVHWGSCSKGLVNCSSWKEQQVPGDAWQSHVGQSLLLSAAGWGMWG